MLTFIKISNFALIENSEIEFGPGFNVITGESGAGKSILMAAVALLLGGRVDHNVIRSGCDRCTVSGAVAVPAELREEIDCHLEAAGVPFEENEKELQFRRTIGHTAVRNFLNDTPVSARLLGEVGSLLIDMHGAGDQLSLLHQAHQLALLDRYAGAAPLQRQCREIWEKIEALKREQEEFERHLPDAAEVSRLELLLEDIGKVDPVAGEDEKLEGKFKLAANARQAIECAGNVCAMLTEAENCVADRLGEIYRKLSDFSRIDEKRGGKLLSACDVLQESVVSLSGEVSAAVEGIDLDAEALAAIENRLGEIYTLKRRYGPTLDQVLTAREEAEKSLSDFHRTKQRREEFAVRRKELQNQLAAAAGELSSLRQKKGRELAAATQARLASIGFRHSTVLAGFEAVEPGPNGSDRLELLFSANTGEEPLPLRKIASSGELSRLMLALKTVLADADSVPVSVFDEIDANIGGETAAKVGEELHSLGRHRQILCISHQALVAARADRHYCVIKYAEGDRTFSESRQLKPAERIVELGRMLGGGKSGETHARAILKNVNPEP